jgi:O-antigen ligase
MALAARVRWTGALLGLALVLLGLVCGRAVVETQAIDSGTGLLLLGVVGALVALAVMVASPVACLAALAGFSMLTFQPSVAIGGALDVKAADAFYVALLGWAALRLLGPTPPRSGLPTVRGAPILLLLSFAGLTILYVAMVDPGGVGTSFLSWLRLVQTLSIAFLAALLVRSTRDVKIILGAVAVAGSVAVGVALIGGAGSESGGALGGRGGGLNPNTLGLVSGFLVLMAFLRGLGPQLLYRVPLALVGAVGLIQAKSLGALIGTCVAVTLGLVLLRAQRPTVVGLRTVKTVTALVLALGLAYAFASAVRPENLPQSEAFRSSSAWHRTVVGVAGLELAARNPIIGVGWRRSSFPDVIGDPEVTTALRRRFVGTEEDVFPDVAPTSVHNTYVQVAAELGLIGLALLGVVLYALLRDIRRLLGSLPRGTMAWTQLWYLAWALVLILVWLNDNPIFGGQPETVAFAIFVGCIAGLGKHAGITTADEPPSQEASPTRRLEEVAART